MLTFLAHQKKFKIRIGTPNSNSTSPFLKLFARPFSSSKPQFHLYPPPSRPKMYQKLAVWSLSAMQSIPLSFPPPPFPFHTLRLSILILVICDQQGQTCIDADHAYGVTNLKNMRVPLKWLCEDTKLVREEILRIRLSPSKNGLFQANMALFGLWKECNVFGIFRCKGNPFAAQLFPFLLKVNPLFPRRIFGAN